MASLLTKKKVLSLVLETHPNVPATTLDTVGNMVLAIEEATLDPDVETVTDDILRDSLTPTPGSATFKRARLRTRHKIRGTNSGTGAPIWGRLLRACGMRQATTNVLPLDGAITGGPLRHGEIVTGGTSMATGRVLHDTYSGATFLLVEVLSGTFDVGGETLTGGSTGATVDTDAGVTLVGHTWYPISLELASIGVTGAAMSGFGIGHVFRGQTSGAIGIATTALAMGDGVITYRPVKGLFTPTETLENLTNGTGTGTAASSSTIQMETISAKLWEDGVFKVANHLRGTPSFQFDAGGHAYLTCELQGAWNTQGDSPNPTGVAIQAPTPPLLQGVTVAMGYDGLSTEVAELDPGCFAQIQIAMANQVSQRTCAQSASGIAGFDITNRAPTISLDPDATFEAAFPWFAKMLAAETVGLRRLRFGNADRNRFQLSVPAFTLTALPRGDREGTMTTQIAGNINGGLVGNLAGSAVTITNPGSDNEVVLSYFHTDPGF